MKKEFENEVHGDPFLLNGLEGFHSQVAVRDLLSGKVVSIGEELHRNGKGPLTLFLASVIALSLSMVKRTGSSLFMAFRRQ